MRKTLVIVGLSFIALGWVFCASAVRGGEKATAIFFLGHWFDIIWELAVPCFTLGVVLCASASLRFSFFRRRGTEARSSEGT